MFLSKDFIETAQGLVFAVVEQGLEQGKVLCFLRYIADQTQWKKLSTKQANTYLKNQYPQYLFYSELKQCHLHALPVDKIVKHHQPKQRLQSLLQNQAKDRVENDLQHLLGLFAEKGLNLQQIGVTGSLLIGAQNTASDIDLVIYDRCLFFQTRFVLQQLIKDNLLQDLVTTDWLASYQRRACALSLDEYIRHERRKYNKALINSRKFDIALLDLQTPVDTARYQKVGKIIIQSKIKDDRYTYDYPARFILSHESIKECLSYTATYTGQAENAEYVEISGLLEQAENGAQRIIVGSSREALGEYIKLLR